MTAAPLRVQSFQSSKFLDDVLSGLRSNPKTLPPKLFYDARGAELFEQICDLPEYYLTRSELTILRECVGDIAKRAGPDCAVIEYGSGAGIKVRLLLDALESPRAYVPVDISREQLQEVAYDLSEEYPQITVAPVCADYTQRFELPDLPHATRRRVAFFPGSTIGNFHPAEAAAFLSRVRQLVGPGGALILGVDRVKTTRVLDAAYNDSLGITAEFNRNILDRINRETGADFNVPSFEHVAFFNRDASRIEMHLRARSPQLVHIGGETISFAAGETIWTESSYKYDEGRLTRLASSAGFQIEKLWTDELEQFWVAWVSV